MIRVTLVITELSRKGTRVRGAIELRSQSFEASNEEFRILHKIVDKVKEIGREIDNEVGGEALILEKPNNARYSEPANN